MVMCEWTLADVKNRASNKAFAKTIMLESEVNNLKDDLRRGLYGGVTREDIELCLESTKKQLQVWNYIAGLIEKQ